MAEGMTSAEFAHYHAGEQSHALLDQLGDTQSGERSMNKGPHFVGQTRDTGFQIGVRRTLLLAHEAAWQLIVSPAGVNIWLGAIKQELAQGISYRLHDGTTGVVTVFTPNSHLRMTWQPLDWNRSSTMQVRVLPNGDRSTIAFHQEWLPGPSEREERRAWFAAALDQLENFV